MVIPDKKLKNQFVFPVFLMLIFFSVSLIGILHHEIWLDEAHSFLIARDSFYFSDLIRNSRQEGHPMLWYCLLWLLNKISRDVFYMQLLHIMISSATIFLMALYAPFNKLKKILFAFSYYFFFEYNILCRNYGLCIFFITVWCILICSKKKYPIVIACVLALLANTHFLGLILSLSLAAVVVFIYMNDKTNYENISLKQWIISACIIMLAYAICIQHVLPEVASMFTKLDRPGYFSMKRWSSFTVLFKGLFQFPYTDDSSWNTNIFTQYKSLGFIFTATVTVISIKAFFNKPLSFFILFVSTFCLSVFFYLEFMHNYTVRHWGFVFLAFYVAIWLAEGLDQEKLWEKLKTYRLPALLLYNHTYVRDGLLYSALIVQVAASIYMFVWDYNKPFCISRKVAEYIRENNYPEDLIIVSSFTSGPAISAYMDKKLYYPEYHGYGTYGVWNTWPVFITQEELFQEVKKCREKVHANALLLLNERMYTNIDMSFFNDENSLIAFVKQFDGGFKTNEHYRLYLVTYK
jgi:hypothetical protein